MSFYMTFFYFDGVPTHIALYIYRYEVVDKPKKEKVSNTHPAEDPY